MNGTLDSLIECMNREKQILEEFSDLALRKRQVIILGDVKELDAMIRREASLLNALNKAEAERIKLQGDLGREHSVDAEKMTAAELRREVIDKYYGGQSDEFREVIVSITAASNTIKDINQLNAELLNHSLAYIESVENMLLGMNGPVYSEGGVVREVPKQHKVLDKSV